MSTERLLFFLDFKTIHQLLLVNSKFFKEVLGADEFWGACCDTIFGGCCQVIEILRSHNLEFLAEGFVAAPPAKNQMSRFRDFLSAAYNRENLSEARELAEEGTVESFSKACALLLRCLEQNSDDLHAFYLIACICYQLNQIEAAREILSLGKDRLSAMEGECENFFDDLHELVCSDKQLALVQNGELLPEVRSILCQLFSRFKTSSGGWGFSDFYDFACYGGHSQGPTREQFGAILTKYQGSNQQYLSLESFLSFYLEQSISDPDETIADLQRCGYSVEQQ